MRATKAKRLRVFIEALADQMEDGELFHAWMQPDSANPHRNGDQVTHRGKNWESQADGNIREPGTGGWEEIS